MPALAPVDRSDMLTFGFAIASGERIKPTGRKRVGMVTVKFVPSRLVFGDIISSDHASSVFLPKQILAIFTRC